MLKLNVDEPVAQKKSNRGRKKIEDPEDRHSHAVSVTFTPKDYEAVVARAEAAGMKAATYVRYCVELVGNKVVVEEVTK